LWRASYSLLKEFGMEVMVDLEEATPAELRIVDVDIRRNNRRQTIE